MTTFLAVLLGLLVAGGLVGGAWYLTTSRGDQLAWNAGQLAQLGQSAPAITQLITTANSAVGVQNTVNNVANTITTVAGTVNSILDVIQGIGSVGRRF